MNRDKHCHMYLDTKKLLLGNKPLVKGVDIVAFASCQLLFHTEHYHFVFIITLQICLN